MKKIIYQETDGNNYKQIRSDLNSWNKMRQDEKDIVNANLTANGGKTYEELLKQANDVKV